MAIDTTRQLIQQIANASQIGENTAARVGGAMEAILNDVADAIEGSNGMYNIVRQVALSIGVEIPLSNTGIIKDGVINPDGDGHYSDYIDIENSFFSLWTYGATVYSAVNYYDANKAFLSSVNYPAAIGGHWLDVLTPPEGAKYAIFGANNYIQPTRVYVGAAADLIGQINTLKNLLTKQEQTATTTATSPEYVMQLKAGRQYSITAKTATLGTSTSTNIGVWVKVGSTQTEIRQATAAELYSGITFVYTPADDALLGVRMMQVGIEFTLTAESAENVGRMAEELADVKAVTDAIGNALRREDQKTGTTTATAVEYVANLVGGTKYTITIKTASLTPVTDTRIGLWVKNDGNRQTQILSSTPAKLYAGETIDYTPSEDVSLGCRTLHIGDDFQITLVYYDQSAMSGGKSQWDGANVVLWGDSITAQGNGQNNPSSFLIYAAREHKFNVLYARGIGGQTFTWNDDGWYTQVGSLGNYLDRYNYNASGTKLSTVVKPATITQQEIGYIESAKGVQIEIHYGSFCSWDRITAMIPDTIKDTIDLVVICGGTNDFYAVEETSGSGEVSAAEPTWVANSNVDAAWAASTEYNGGDYDINQTLSGGIASAVMKLRTRCPNAVVVLATPFPKFNLTTKQQFVNTAGLKMSQFCEMLHKIAAYVNVPVISSSEASGIDGTIFGSLVSDSTHPNEAGRKMFGRTFIGALKDIAKKIQ